MAMSVGEAFHYLKQIDAIYMELYLQKMEMLGELACGMPGYPVFSTVSEIAKRMKSRKHQITELRAEIEALEVTQSVDEPAVRQMAKEFNLKPWNPR